MFNWILHSLLYSVPWWFYVLLFMVVLGVLYKTVGVKNSLYVIGVILTLGVLQKQRQAGYKDHKDMVDEKRDGLQARYDEVDANNNPDDAYNRLRERSGKRDR